MDAQNQEVSTAEIVLGMLYAIGIVAAILSLV